MKFTLEIEINRSIKEVTGLFDDLDNVKHWQPGLISYEFISGERGKPGAKTKMKYKYGKREMEMTETITVFNPPEEYAAIYESKGVWNEVKNYFKKIDADKTKWISDIEFRFSGFMKYIVALVPGSVKKQSYKYMVKFKNFAESK